jgi:hypothetical protein
MSISLQTKSLPRQARALADGRKPSKPVALWPQRMFIAQLALKLGTIPERSG